MVMRALAALAFCLVPIGSACAEERAGTHRASCTIIRYYVAKYTAPAAEAWARGNGASDAEIEAARRCLGGASGQAMQAASLNAR
jgi:hypothetical protein